MEIHTWSVELVNRFSSRRPSSRPLDLEIDWFNQIFTKPVSCVDKIQIKHLHIWKYLIELLTKKLGLVFWENSSAKNKNNFSAKVENLFSLEFTCGWSIFLNYIYVYIQGVPQKTLFKVIWSLKLDKNGWKSSFRFYWESSK